MGDLTSAARVSRLHFDMGALRCSSGGAVVVPFLDENREVGADLFATGPLEMPQQEAAVDAFIEFRIVARTRCVEILKKIKRAAGYTLY